LVVLEGQLKGLRQRAKPRYQDFVACHPEYRGLGQREIWQKFLEANPDISDEYRYLEEQFNSLNERLSFGVGEAVVVPNMLGD
jgi:hypothetical protein